MKETASSDVLIIHTPGFLAEAERTASKLRDGGIRADVYLITDVKMKRVYDYLDKNSIPFLLTVGETMTLRDQRTRESVTLGDSAEIIEKIKA